MAACLVTSMSQNESCQMADKCCSDRSQILQTQKANQEDVSAWMTGIVEVPLSVSQRMKNVEETEEAKRRLLAQSGGNLTG